jgi:predicted regulator of Ras-like GTPase activity (Roadblock/LC7/MglB family)
MSRQESLQKLLEGLRSAIPDLRGALVASTDGLAMVHSLPAGVDPGRIAAMAATALGLGKRISDTMGIGILQEANFNANEGQMFIYTAGGQGVLALIAPSNANVGLIHFEARDVARQIASTLTNPS